jgi:hypothetical protein
MVTPTTQTIRIKRRGPRGLYFDIEDHAGQRFATSSPFDTICRLESGLAVLIQAAQKPHVAVVERDDRSTSIRVGSTRKRVHFIGRLTDSSVHDLLTGIDTAMVMDERPANQRRADLSGRLCELDF